MEILIAMAPQPVYWPQPYSHFFLQSLLCLVTMCPYFILSRLLASFHSFPSHLFLGFLAGLLFLKLPFRICFVDLMSSVLATCPTHF